MSTAPVEAPKTVQAPNPVSESTPPNKTAPSPSAAPKNEAIEDPYKDIGNPMEELDRLAGVSKPAENEEETTEEKPEVKPQETDAELADKFIPKGKQAQMVEEPKKEEFKGSARELRQALENSKKEAQKLRDEINALKKPKAPQDDPDRKALMERLDAESKRREELEKEIKYVSYERSSEYKEQYEKPIIDAFKTAHDEVQQFVVETGDGQRAGTPADFNRLVQITDTNQALKEARALFGDAASEVMANRRRILELDRNRREAVERHKLTASEREKEMAIQRERQQSEFKSMQQSVTQQMIDTYPQLFGPQEGDEEGNKLLEKGVQVADLAWSNDLPPEKAVAIRAVVRNKAAAFDRIYVQNQSLKSKISELEEKLKKFESSEPGDDDGGEKADNGEVSALEEIDRLAGRR